MHVLGEIHQANFSIEENIILLKVCVLEQMLNTLECQEKIDAALKMYQELYDKSVLVFGKNHPTTLAIKRNIKFVKNRHHQCVKTCCHLFDARVSI